ncbi:MAG: acyl-CoA synthetase [Firmicutes bacterium HGW-Firmicutes-21]|nr:MAG: acyl-CoA synthetase [Firmicutes bacterium HGW-Firmicutes-21]
MENQTKLIAERLKFARINAELSAAQLAASCGIDEEKYLILEEGNDDFSFTFLYKCAIALGMDISELVLGVNPKLGFYNITRAGEGMPIKRREGFNYRHIAPLLKNRMSEPFIVTAKFDSAALDNPIPLSTHTGQEFNMVLSGSLKIQLDDHVVILNEGDTVYYDSAHRHGMIAAGGEDCTFLAIVFKPTEGAAEDIEPTPVAQAENKTGVTDAKYDNLIYKKFVKETVAEDGTLVSFETFPTSDFNFSYDVLDALAKKSPDKPALVWVSAQKEERIFTFSEMSILTNKTANYLRSLGIKRGDRVMLVLKRHYQFWMAILALHKLGAVAIPATNLLVEKDYIYRFNAGKVRAIICTADGICADEVDKAAPQCPTLEIKSLAKGTREGWSDFDSGVEAQSEIFERVETSKDDPSIMFFTSGTTGYPKIATHSATYPLGHIITARWWHYVDPDGLHLTISDTGWGKALWGKLYGQWFCECAVFVYDMEKFVADDLLPLFAKHNITTFCAPPTMYRILIKEDLSKYDLSSIKYATTAGEALNPEVFNRFKEATGLVIMEGFGQTETTLTVGNLYGTKPKIGSMGVPIPAYNMDILREDGTPADIGEVGEIVLRTEKDVCGMFMGYYMNEEKTNEVWKDNIYYTGDTAWRDEDGYYWYVGRTDDVIKSSGYRIGPFEIESVIMELPYVLECAITGVPDETRGQVVKATVVLTKDREPSEELKKEIQEYVKKHTAPYKYPRRVEFVTSLPKTISGKIRRVELKT